MLYRVAIVVLASACGFDHGKLPGGNNGMIDAPGSVDAAIDAPPDIGGDARSCFGTFVEICLTAPWPTDYAVGAATNISTDSTVCTLVVPQTNGPALCVIAADRIHVDAPLQVSGQRPLVLLATSTLDISATGIVDVGSYRNPNGVGEIIGAGSGTGGCGAPSNGSDDAMGTSSGAGGGAGGSFIGSGGAGVAGRDGAGGAGATPTPALAAPTVLRGGCRGSNGGSGNSLVGGSAGFGGGGVLLVAGTSITNAGHVRAGGQGGWGGASTSGGGGGGSGGMIVIDGPFTNTGILNANGGGGGEGGGMNGGGNGGSSYAGTGPAPGGMINVNGGDGGSGSWTTTLTGGGGGTDTLGGGAGAGGAGYIHLLPAQTPGGTVSPTPS